MKPKVLVLGGHGFIGRHAVASLLNQNLNVTIGTRAPSAMATPITDTPVPEIRVQFEALMSTEDWLPITEAYDVILNCVGILRPTRHASYEQVHHLTPRLIADACRRSDTRFVHVSALGLSDRHRSGFLTSKLAGERAIQDSAAQWIIVRPSLLDGDGGFGASWLRGVATLPLYISPIAATGKIAALTASDLGDALARLCTGSAEQLNLAHSRFFDLGGPTLFTFASYIRALRSRHTSSSALAIPLPSGLARLGAHLCDLFRFSPFSFGHWELLCQDNVPAENRLEELLGRPPSDVIHPANQPSSDDDEAGA